MAEKLTELDDETKTELRRREPIAHDDATAHCTAAGWEAGKAARDAARPEADVPGGRFWAVDSGDKDKGLVFIECERYVDARSFARRKFGADIKVTAIETNGKIPIDRWQVKWAGSALDPRDPHHMVARYVNDESHFAHWRDIRDVK